MLIPINDNYRLTSDQHNIIIQTSHVAGKKAKKPGEVVWKDDTFHPTIAMACVWLMRQKVRDSDIEELTQLADQMFVFKLEIIEAINKAGLEKK